MVVASSNAWNNVPRLLTWISLTSYFASAIAPTNTMPLPHLAWSICPPRHYMLLAETSLRRREVGLADLGTKIRSPTTQNSHSDTTNHQFPHGTRRSLADRRRYRPSPDGSKKLPSVASSLAASRQERRTKVLPPPLADEEFDTDR